MRILFHYEKKVKTVMINKATIKSTKITSLFPIKDPSLGFHFMKFLWSSPPQTALEIGRHMAFSDS